MLSTVLQIIISLMMLLLALAMFILVCENIYSSIKDRKKNISVIVQELEKLKLENKRLLQHNIEIIQEINKS